MNVKCQESILSERTIIDTAQEGRLHGSLRSRLSRRPPHMVSELMMKMEEYAWVEDDDLREKQQKQAGEHHSHQDNRKTKDRESERCSEQDEPRPKWDSSPRPVREVHTVDAPMGPGERRKDNWEEHRDDRKREKVAGGPRWPIEGQFKVEAAPERRKNGSKTFRIIH